MTPVLTEEVAEQINAELTRFRLPTQTIKKAADKSEEVKVSTSTHPDYEEDKDDWTKFRLVMKGGRQFRTAYLKKFTEKETASDFQDRRDITYVPAHAKAAVLKIKNAIFSRMVDITRVGGSEAYQTAIKGGLLGVDKKGRSMNTIIGNQVIQELITMRKVGVYIDRNPFKSDAPSLFDTEREQPYGYVYKAEDIRNWTEIPNSNGKFLTLILRDHGFELDAKTYLIRRRIEVFRHLILIPDVGVLVRFFDNENNQLGGDHLLPGLKRIPIHIFEISESLLKDIADYQVSMLNMAGSDMNYVTKANFPFLTEQFAPGIETARLKQANRSDGANEGTETEKEKTKDRTTKVGVTRGRRYPQGLDRPQFIHPSAEPLDASRRMSGELKEEINQLINLALTNIEPRRASAKSKQLDEGSKEEGLSAIGLELEFGERQIAQIWADYEDTNQVATINYPVNYTLKTEVDRRREGKELGELLPTIPSLTYQKELAKQIARVTIGHTTETKILKKIESEIENAKIIASDPEVILADLEAGVVTAELASEARGYPKGEAAKAQKEKAERLKIIKDAQSGDGARGVDDTDPDPKLSANLEKDKSQNEE